jgi:hypothetical protein
MLATALLGARSQLLSMSLALENQIRGILMPSYATSASARDRPRQVRRA